MTTDTNIEPRLIRVADAAAALGIGRTTAYTLIDSGELSTVTVGRRRLVVATSLDKYVARLVASTTSAKSA